MKIQVPINILICLHWVVFTARSDEISYGWLNHLTDTDRPTCLTSLNQCHKKVDFCKFDTDILLRSCGNMWRFDWPLLGCRRKNQKACYGAVYTMREKNADLKNCSCAGYADTNSLEYQRCLLLWRSLNEHPCIRKEPLYLSASDEQRANRELSGNSSLSDRKPPQPQPPTIPPGFYENNNQGGIKKPIDVFDESGDLYEKKDPLEASVRSKLRGSLRMLVHHLGMRPITSSLPQPEGQLSSKSCLFRKNKCFQNRTCQRHMKDFKTNCTIDKCESRQCFGVYDDFRQFEMFDCSCDAEVNFPGRLTECIEYQAEFFDNKCLAMINSRSLYQTLPILPNRLVLGDKSSSQSMSKSKHGLYPQSTSNCHKAYLSCLDDASCPPLYTKMQTLCLKVNNTCKSPVQCSHAVANFYRQPRAFANNAMACDCAIDGSDEECERQKKVFHPLCSGGQGSKPDRNNNMGRDINCLTLMAQCVGNLTCLDTYSLFSEVCISSGQHGVCQFTPSQCLDISRATRDTVLMHKCSCHLEESFRLTAQGRITQPLSICNGFKKSIEEPFCLKKRKIPALPSTSLNWENACIIQRRHRLPASSNIRVYNPRSSFIMGTTACSRACHCREDGETNTCSDIPCPSRTSQSDALTNRKPYGSSNENRSCTYVPHQGQSCECFDGLLTCRPFYLNSRGVEHSTISLLVRYDPVDLALLTNVNLAWNFHRIGNALTTLLNSIAGGGNCKLSMTVHKGNEVTYLMGYRRSRIPSGSSNQNRWIRNCLGALQLVHVMIENQYPEIKHNLPLSILKWSQLKLPLSDQKTQQHLTNPFVKNPIPEEKRPSNKGNLIFVKFSHVLFTLFLTFSTLIL